MGEEVVSGPQNRLYLDVFTDGLQYKRCLWLSFGCAVLPVWVEGLLENMMCPSDSLLSICTAKPWPGRRINLLLHTVYTHTGTHAHPAASTMCEACSTSLSHPCVKVTACSLFIFSVKTWEQWIVSCLHQWTHSVRVLTKGYELLSTKRKAQLDLTQNTHFGCWPINTPKLSY